MNQRSKKQELQKDLGNDRYQPLETVPTSERLVTQGALLPTFGNNPDKNQENERLVTTNLNYLELPTSSLQKVGNASPPLKGGSVTNLENEAPTFDELITLRHRLNDGVAWCQRRIGSPGKQRRGIDRYVRLLVQEYMPGIREHRNSDHDYASELATVEARLARGADVEGHDDLFAGLLTTYEVLYDITHEDATARHLDRMEYVTA